MRFYANGADAWYSPTWGYYIVSSLHWDYEKTNPWPWGGCTAFYYSTETNENFWNNRVITMNELISPDWVINTNTLCFANPETARWVDANHYVASNGWGSIVYVP